MQEVVKKMIKDKLIQSAHDISEGGLFVNLVESAMAGDTGFAIETDPAFRKDAYLFGEAQSRIVVSVTKAKQDDLKSLLTDANIPFTHMGKVTSSRISVDGEDFGEIAGWKELYDTSLEKKLKEN